MQKGTPHQQTGGTHTNRFCLYLTLPSGLSLKQKEHINICSQAHTGSLTVTLTFPQQLFTSEILSLIWGDKVCLFPQTLTHIHRAIHKIVRKESSIVSVLWGATKTHFVPCTGVCGMDPVPASVHVWNHVRIRMSVRVGLTHVGVSIYIFKRKTQHSLSPREIKEGKKGNEGDETPLDLSYSHMRCSCKVQAYTVCCRRRTSEVIRGFP